MKIKFLILLLTVFFVDNIQAKEFYTEPTTFIVNLEDRKYLEFRIYIGVRDPQTLSALVNGNSLIVDRIYQTIWGLDQDLMTDPRRRPELLKQLTRAVKSAVQELGDNPKNIDYVLFESYKVIG